MTEETPHAQALQQPPTPHPALKRLEVLIGTWHVKGRESGPHGEIHGQVSYEWMEGGFFLVQHVDLDYIGHKVKGIEIIGYDASRQVCTSYRFDNVGNAFTYTYDLYDDTLTITGLGFLAGISTTEFDLSAGVTAAFTGKLSDDGNTLTGRWEWPGGGYEATATRANPAAQPTGQK